MILLENGLKMSLQDVLKMSWRRLGNVLKTSWRPLEEVLKTSWRGLKDVLKTSWRGLENVLKTSWRRLEEVWPRRIYWSWRRRLEDALKTYSEHEDERRCQDVFKTSSSRRMFAGIVSYSGFLMYNLDKYIANILKAYVEDKIRTPRILPHFSVHKKFSYWRRWDNVIIWRHFHIHEHFSNWDVKQNQGYVNDDD